MSSLQRVERVDFQIAPGIFIDFYRFPDGEKRIGVTGAAIACGYKKNYLTELEDKSPDRLKTLRSKGFDGSRRHGMIERASMGGRGSAKAATLSQHDFIAFIKYASSVGKKPQAQALLEALAGVAIEAIARTAFGEESLTLDEIRLLICRDYAKALNWLQEDAEDALGIEDHLMFLRVC